MSKNKQTIAYDYNGVSEVMNLPDDITIITGKSRDEEDEIREKYPNADIHFFDAQDELNDENMDAKIGAWKGLMVKKLGIDKYFEDSPEQIEIIKAMNPDVNVVRVVDGIPDEKMKFIIFIYYGMFLPIAKKLQDEGNEVVIARIDNFKNVLLDEELKGAKPEKDTRFKMYDGILSIHSAESVIKEMKMMKDKDDWFIFGESNNIFKFSEMAENMGFKNGYFPNEEDRKFEIDRDMAKEFVKEFYPDISETEVKKFNLIDEAKEFISETDKIWVVKSMSDSGDTVVPDTDDVEQAKEIILSKLEDSKKEYEQSGFILEEKICNVCEVTPEIVFYNGTPIFYSIDIENKPIAEGSSTQCECAQNLIIQTDKDDRINKIAFPEKIYEMAKEHTGFFVWDASLLIDTKSGKIYFGEFCSNRIGWDSFPTEISMCQSATHFFRCLIALKNPFIYQYGVAVRLFNIGNNCELIKDEIISASSDTNIFLRDVYEKNGLRSVGYTWDIATCVGHGDTIEKATECAYDAVKNISYPTKYFRSMNDFLSYRYPTSILNRLSYIRSNNFISNEEFTENLL